MKKIISCILILCFALCSFSSVAVMAEEEPSVHMSLTPVCESETVEVGDQFIVSFSLEGVENGDILPYLTFRMNGSFDTAVAQVVAPVYTNAVLGILTNKFNNEDGTFTFEGYDQRIRGTSEKIVCSILFEATAAGTFSVNLADDCMLGKADENAFYNLSINDCEIEIAENSDDETVSIITDPEPKTPYDEIIMGHWAEKAIGVMYELGALKNIADETIETERNITRGEFATMLVKICKLKTSSDAENFADVPEDSYMYESLRVLKALKLAYGDGEGNFMPDEPITRQDAFTLMFRTMIKMNKVDSKIDAESYLANFEDKDEIAAYAVDPFAGMFRAKLLSDNTSVSYVDPETGETVTVNKCNPAGNVSLAQACYILNKLAEFNILVSR